MDIIIALIPALCWGSIGLASGKIGGNANQQTLGMTLGALAFAGIVFVVKQPTMDLKVVVAGIAAGLLWSVGQNQQFKTMKYLGIAKTLPMSTGMQLIVNTLSGAILFHEWKNGREVTFGLVALVILILGATLTAKRDQNAEDTRDKKQVSRGMIALIVSTLGYGSYTVVINYAHVDTMAVILPQAVGMVIGAFAVSLKSQPIHKKTFQNMFTGLLWGVGNVFMLLAMARVGLALSFSLAQMGIIISTLGSIFVLGEKKTKKEMVYVTVGCVLVIAGGLLLGYMKAV